MKKTLIFFLVVLCGCLGGESINGGSDVEVPLSPNLTALALNSEDLGFTGWVPSSENKTVHALEKQFIKVEDSFGSFSRLANRVHLYPDEESAKSDYTSVAEHLELQLSTTRPDVGDSSLLYTGGNRGYLLFIRGNIIVELEHVSAGPLEKEFMIDLAKKVDSRIMA
jgi:hypothetical protein